MPNQALGLSKPLRRVLYRASWRLTQLYQVPHLPVIAQRCCASTGILSRTGRGKYIAETAHFSSLRRGEGGLKGRMRDFVLDRLMTMKVGLSGTGSADV